MFSTISFTTLKRSRSNTSYTPNTYCRFNSRGYKDNPYKYLYKCLKYSKDYTTSSKVYTQEQQGRPYNIGSTLTIILTLTTCLGARLNILLLFTTFIYIEALCNSLLLLRILAQRSLLSSYLGKLLAILIGILTYSYKIGTKSPLTLQLCRNYNSLQDNTSLITKKIMLELLLGYI